MSPILQIAVWNANGLCQHKNEIQMFLLTHNIDIFLISETHFTSKTFFHIPHYNTYHTNHPSGTARGGSAILIKTSVQHYLLNPYSHDYLQATSISIDGPSGLVTISAVYLPPNHTLNYEQLTSFYSTLGPRFLVGGDYNAKHTDWGSRLISPRGRLIHKILNLHHYDHLSTGEPTYWPTDRNKLPDLVDFCITKGIPPNYLTAKSCFELSSDHTPILISLSHKTLPSVSHPSLYNKKTNWDYFRLLLSDKLSPNIPLKTAADIEAAVNNLTKLIQWAGWSATPVTHYTPQITPCPLRIKQKILDKRRLRRTWLRFHSPITKRLLNKASQELKQLISEYKNQQFQAYTQNLSPTLSTDYSLWKAVRSIKHITISLPPIRTPQDTWARTNKEKALIFAHHLSTVFHPHPPNISFEDEINLLCPLDIPYQLEPPPKPFKQSEILTIINTLKPKTSPGFDLITAKILQNLPPNCIKNLTQIINASIRLCYFPNQWKVAQIILILKPGKPTDLPSSYRPISLLPTLSKVFEKLIFQRLLPIVETQHILPDHQFGFRYHHSTIHQTHRLVNKIHDAIESKQYCSAAFLDISQAFDKVWHIGLHLKLRQLLPLNYFLLLKSYLSNRHFIVKVGDEFSNLSPIHAGVPQGSVLGPLLYLLFTNDLPTSPYTTTATFADDTAILASDPNPVTASLKLQNNLNSIENWLSLWRLKANETKSYHVTFSNRKATCPPVYLYNEPLPQTTEVKYLGFHLDRRLTWKKHIFNKRKHLGILLTKLHWLLGRRSKLTLNNKLLIYKIIIKPVWTYGIQLWGSASNTNIAIFERFQSKALRLLTDAPWYVPNAIIRHDLQIPTVQEEISRLSSKYRSRLNTHINQEVSQLSTPPPLRRLRRHLPHDLPNRFLV